MPTDSYYLGRIIITCECGQCGRPFSFEHLARANINSRSLPNPLPQELARIRKTLEDEAQNVLATKKGLAAKKCPHCKQYQS
jgi:hypothetical protein